MSGVSRLNQRECGVLAARRGLVAALLIACGLSLASCSRTPDAPPEEDLHDAGGDPAASNRVDVPPTVRRNLGLTFAKVERRAVSHTIRMPGQFELLPEARREYRTMLAGQVELLATQFERVEPGTVLYRLRSPQWRELQQQISEAESQIESARAASETIGPLRAAHRIHEVSLDQTVILWTERVDQLTAIRQSGGGKADELALARATLTGAQAELADVREKDAELEARNREITAQLSAAGAKKELLLATASTVVGIPISELMTVEGDAPKWRTIDAVEVRAVAPGVVESVSVTNGAWAEASSMVLSTAQSERVRFHARGLQSDLGRLRDGLGARVLQPFSQGAPSVDAGSQDVSGRLTLGLSADPEHRTIDLYLTPAAGDVRAWCRPGVSAFMEVTLDGGQEELAVPLSSVARDGLAYVIFRRDPKKPDVVIRLDADLGIDDGRWIAVNSGVMEGDEVVLDGVYQLMLATSGSAAKGGHFHSDGTFHEGKD